MTNRIKAVLTAHRYAPNPQRLCICGWDAKGTLDVLRDAHETHLAAVIELEMAKSLGRTIPWVTIELDVDPTPAGGDAPTTTEELAQWAWDDVKRWAREGYLPVVEVHYPDGKRVMVDLECVDGDCDEYGEPLNELDTSEAV